MNSKEINTILYNFCIPESLKTNDFKITTFLTLKKNGLSSCNYNINSLRNKIK